MLSWLWCPRGLCWGGHAVPSLSPRCPQHPGCGGGRGASPCRCQPWHTAPSRVSLRAIERLARNSKQKSKQKVLMVFYLPPEARRVKWLVASHASLPSFRPCSHTQPASWGSTWGKGFPIPTSTCCRNEASPSLSISPDSQHTLARRRRSCPSRRGCRMRPAAALQMALITQP